MGVEIISNPLSVSALLSGEIDHHTAAAMRADIDAAAAALCRDNDMPVLIFDLGDGSNIEKAAAGEQIGTVLY